MFGYQGPHEYWMLVLQKGDAATGGRYLYHVQDGAKQMKAHTAFAVNAGASEWIMDFAKRNYDPVMNYDYGVEGYGGFPTGKVGLVSSRAGVKVDYFMVYDDALNADVMGRWAANGAQTANASSYLDISASWLSQLNPILLKGVSIGSEGGWRATFSLRRPSSTSTHVFFAFNAKNQDQFNYLRVYHSDAKTAPYGYKFSDGHYDWVSGTRTNDNTETFTVEDTLWVRVASSSGTVTVKCIKKNDGPPSEQDWSGKSACYVSDQFNGVSGTVGFLGDTGVRVSNFSLCYADPNGGPTITEDFSLTDGYASLSPAYDAAGNMTCDGLFNYTYDAWNRLTTVTRKCSESAETNVAFAYDGLGRRIGKTVSHMGDRDCIYQFYYDDQQLIETRAYTNSVIKQYVWGTQYVDELLEIGVNTNPSSDNTCDQFYRVLQDANYNVMGLIDSEGDFVERYEYTPYGQRTVYKRASSSQTKPMCPILDSQRVIADSTTQPYGLCEFGHQGLYHDEEVGIIYNRARYVHPLFGTFMSTDPLGYVDGMNLFEYLRSSPANRLDSTGRWSVEDEIRDRQTSWCARGKVQIPLQAVDNMRDPFWYIFDPIWWEGDERYNTWRWTAARWGYDIKMGIERPVVGAAKGLYHLPGNLYDFGADVYERQQQLSDGGYRNLDNLFGACYLGQAVNETLCETGTVRSFEARFVDIVHTVEWEQEHVGTYSAVLEEGKQFLMLLPIAATTNNILREGPTSRNVGRVFGNLTEAEILLAGDEALRWAG